MISEGVGESMSRSRVPLWDNARFLLMLLVVLGHFIDQYKTDVSRSLFVFIYAFHMPLFIYLSGLFHSNNRIKNKVGAYLVLYLLLKAVICVTFILIGKKPEFRLFYEAGIPWYMLAMAVFIGFTYLTRNVNHTVVLICSIIVACIAGYFPQIGDTLSLSRILVLYPFYRAGVMTDRDKLKELHGNTVFRIVSLVITLGFLFCCFRYRYIIYNLRTYFTARNSYGPDSNNLGALIRLLAYAISSVTGLAFLGCCPERKLPVITEFGTRTLQIYFWHRPVLYYLVYLGIGKELCMTRAGQAAWMLIAVAVTFILGLKPFAFPADTVMRIMNRRK